MSLPTGVPLTPCVLDLRKVEFIQGDLPLGRQHRLLWYTARELCRSRGWRQTSAMSRTSTSLRSASTKPLFSHLPRRCSRQGVLVQRHESLENAPGAELVFRRDASSEAWCLGGRFGDRRFQAPRCSVQSSQLLTRPNELTLIHSLQVSAGS